MELTILCDELMKELDQVGRGLPNCVGKVVHVYMDNWQL